VSSHAQIEAAQAITGQTVTTALENHSFGAVPLHHAPDDRFEDALVRDICDSIAEREVDCVVFALSNADITELTGTGEVLAVLVERTGHDAISRVESLLNTIAMVDIDINIKDSLFEAQKLEDSEDNICKRLVFWTLILKEQGLSYR
jgi:hypothetical protein